MFLSSSKGQEWEEKYRRSHDGQVETVSTMLSVCKKKGIPQETIEKIAKHLASMIAADGDEEGYKRFITVFNAYSQKLFITFDEIEKLESEKQNAKDIVLNTVLLEEDKQKALDFISELDFNEESVSKVKKIAELDFHNPAQPKNGMIIAGVVLILSAYLSLIGIILLIVGIVRKNKAKKNLLNAAEYNFGLLKDVMFSNSAPLTPEEEAKKSLSEKIKDIYNDVIARYVDSDNLERMTLSEKHYEEISKVKKAFSIADDEKILFAYDDTVMNSFAKGFVLTDKKCYLTNSNAFPDRNIAVSFDEIGEISLAKKMGVYYITFGKCSISLTLSPKKDVEQLYEFLQKAISLVKTEGQ